MKYLLYLKRSLLRRTKQHLSLLVILICAFILPLLVSIYRDSSAYGRKMERLDMSKGEAFHISNATQADTELFKDINGLSEPRYENGVVYLNILSEEEWKDFWKSDDYSQIISERIRNSGRTELHVRGYTYEYAHGIQSSETASEQRTLLIINIGVIILSSFIIGSAYKSHIKRFSSDMAILRSCGADNKQIFTIFFAEFAVVFLAAALLAVGISAGIMKLLFMSYLQAENTENLAWVIFRMEPGNTLLHIAMFFVVLTAVITRTLLKFNKESTASSIRSDIQTMELKKTPKKSFAKATPIKTLSSLLLQRTNKTHISCLLVAVPIMSVFLFLFAYLSLDADFISASREYELWIFKSPQFGGFYQEDRRSARLLRGRKGEVLHRASKIL